MKISYLSDELLETQNASQNTVPEVVLEKLDLSSFSEVSASTGAKRYISSDVPTISDDL
ncbi:hypothetical protein FRC08_012492 [Ceratobasidium sp. 394]|nr:hypothetical protein FRC08_012492 [Ceratobasidium sp. 394]